MLYILLTIATVAATATNTTATTIITPLPSLLFSFLVNWLLFRKDVLLKLQPSSKKTKFTHQHLSQPVNGRVQSVKFLFLKSKDVCVCIDSHSSAGDARHSRDLYLSLDAIEALQFLIVGSCDGNK